MMGSKIENRSFLLSNQVSHGNQKLWPNRGAKMFASE